MVIVTVFNGDSDRIEVLCDRGATGRHRTALRCTVDIRGAVGFEAYHISGCHSTAAGGSEPAGAVASAGAAEVWSPGGASAKDSVSDVSRCARRGETIRLCVDNSNQGHLRRFYERLLCYRRSLLWSAHCRLEEPRRP